MASVSSESTALAPPSIFLHRVFEPETYRDRDPSAEKRISSPAETAKFPFPSGSIGRLRLRDGSKLAHAPPVLGVFHPVMNFFDTLDDPPSVNFFPPPRTGGTSTATTSRHRRHACRFGVVRHVGWLPCARHQLRDQPVESETSSSAMIGVSFSTNWSTSTWNI